MIYCGRPAIRIIAACPIGRQLNDVLEGRFALPEDMFDGNNEISGKG